MSGSAIACAGALCGRLLLVAAAIAAALPGCDRDRRSNAASGQTRADGSLSPTANPFTTEVLLREMRATHAPTDGQGRAWFETPDGGRPVARAASSGRWTLVYAAGPAGVAVGGSISIHFPLFIGWTPPQLTDPAAPGYVTVATDASDVELVPKIVRNFNSLRIAIRGRPLVAGDRVRVVYGAGPARAGVNWSAEHGKSFWVEVDGDGDGSAAYLAESPGIDTEPGPAAFLVATWPTTARPGDSVRLTVAVVDAQDNRVPTRGELSVVELPDGVDGPRRIALAADPSEATVATFRVAREGVYRLALRGPGGLSGVANPLVVAWDRPRLVWGDLHGHTRLSDGSGTPEEYFRYARDVAGLEVSALTDHDHWGAPAYLDASPGPWDTIREAVRRFYEPGRFVTLLGYEWTSWLQGHRHVVYFDDDGPLLSSLDPRYDTPAKLWQALRGRHVLTFAHHPAGGAMATNWNLAPDPELEAAVEIVSTWGSSESADTPKPIHNSVAGNFVRDALARSYQLGFVGSGDSHDGHPGCAVVHVHPCGLAGIFAEDLTRSSVLEALTARRTYATNGPRILLDARLDGKPMGAVVPAAAAMVLEGRIVAVEPLEKIEVIRSGRVEVTIPGDNRRELVFERALASLGPGEYVYLRVIQGNGGAAWSSPFFLE